VNASTQNGVDLWQTHTIALGPYPSPKFYRLNTSTNTVSQSGFYFASHTSDDFNASIAANDASDCFVTYTSTNASVGTNAQVRLSGKLSADAGIAAGPNAFTSITFYHPSADNPERWGDYSAVTTDPLNAANAWLVNEKVNTGGLLWEAASYNSDSKQTIPGQVGHRAEIEEAVALAASSFSTAGWIWRPLGTSRQISAIQGWLAYFGLQQETQPLVDLLHLAPSIRLRTKPVVVNASGQLGVAPSSQRFKDEIQIHGQHKRSHPGA